MLESLPFSLLIGTVLGFLTGLGIGGGSLLILWLTLVLGWEQSAARGANLLFFLPAAAISLFFRWRQGVVHWKKLLPAILAGCLCAAVFSWLSTLIQLDLLRKLFGVLLLITGIREITFRPKKHSGTP